MDSRYDFLDRYIYSLLDPREDKQIVYVGQSINPQKRYEQHLNPKSENKRKNEWIKELNKLGLKPILKIETKRWTSQFIAFETEMSVTVHYRNLGYEVLSVSKARIDKIYSI